MVNGCVQFESRQIAISVVAIFDYHRRSFAFPVLGFISLDANILEQSVYSTSLTPQKRIKIPDSLTKFWNTNDFLLRIQQFCYLLNMAHPPNKERIRLDFLLLFLMSRQWRNFRREWKHKGMYFPPGGNEDVSALIDDKDVDNPVPDFVTYTR